MDTTDCLKGQGLHVRGWGGGCLFLSRSLARSGVMVRIVTPYDTTTTVKEHEVISITPPDLSEVGANRKVKHKQKETDNGTTA